MMFLSKKVIGVFLALSLGLNSGSSTPKNYFKLYPTLKSVRTISNSQSVQDMVERLNPTVVCIVTTNIIQTIDKKTHAVIQSKEVSLGSGVIISRDGEIITNYHVVDKEPNTISQVLVVSTMDGRNFIATTLGVSTKLDIALIKIPTDYLPYAKLGDSDRVRVGDPVIVIGNPYGLEHSVTGGIISCKERKRQDNTFIQTDAAVNPGNSGGPLLNMDGEVIGIVSQTLGAPAQNISLALPINAVKNVYSKLRGFTR